MGMFDYVRYGCNCPTCDSDVDGFQTKDTDCVLDVVETRDVDHFYTHCPECGLWIDFDRVGSTSFKMTTHGDDRKIIVGHTKIIEIK